MSLNSDKSQILNHSNFSYMLIYYKYMYSLFLAIGPLIILVFLNLCIIAASVVSKTESGNSGDTIALVKDLFNFLFIGSIH